MAVIAGLSLALVGCGNNEDSQQQTTASNEATAPSASESALPSAAQLQDILNKAADPQVPTDQKVQTVVGGEQAPAIFDALTASREQTKAQLQVVDPVLPGILPNTVSATVNLVLPEREPQVISGVEFVNDGGTWKLDQRWACSLVESALPDQVPPLCKEIANQRPAPDGGAPAPAPAQEGQPAPAPAPEGQPAPAPAPAPEGQPAPAPAPAP
ncbi:hypothetical protein CWC39_09590 [Corynebacterium heidelbergense]|uniref:Low molecular weight antigen MTB12-like C-terminal domain-containing protein n=2 Tax=Corynebacterium heidelbergense TaxID=2055947 RepID=A0A364V9C9_9CORY|nr:hypothetical protein CWC39_09590 [Corynebacterium heidelbergense]